MRKNGDGISRNNWDEGKGDGIIVFLWIMWKQQGIVTRKQCGYSHVMSCSENGKITYFKRRHVVFYDPAQVIIIVGNIYIDVLQSN